MTIMKLTFLATIPWRIHGAGIYIYTNIKGVYWWDPWSTMFLAAPLGSVMAMKSMIYSSPLMKTSYNHH